MTITAIILRPMNSKDHEFLFRVYASTRQEELADVPWTAEQKEAFLRSQFDLQHQHYQKYYEDAAFDIILCDGEPAGRLYVHRSPEEIRIVDIALLPEHRGSGIGSRLLHEVLTEADGAGKRVSIHVEQFNRAMRLYERLGFTKQEEVGVYYRMEWSPVELHKSWC